MNSEFFYSANLGFLLLLHIVILVVALEIGYRVGRKMHKPFFESILQLVPTSLLGLLALLLGFTFSMSVTRFENRKAAVLHETNAIGTAWLRAGLLLKSEDTQAARASLHAYLENRLNFPVWTEPREVRERFAARNLGLQQDLWKIAEKANSTDRTPQSSSFAMALNDVFDRGTDRVFFDADQVPEVTYLIITLLAAASLFSLGALFGQRHLRHRAPFVVAILLALVLSLIHDIDRPAGGLVRVETMVLRELLSDIDHSSR